MYLHVAARRHGAVHVFFCQSLPYCLEIGSATEAEVCLLVRLVV